MDHHGTEWNATECRSAKTLMLTPKQPAGRIMFDQVPPQSGDNPILLRATAAGSWTFVILAAVCAFALVRGYLGAATTAGRIGAILFMGVFICLFVWAAIFLAMHRSTMSIAAGAITYAKAASGKTRAATPQVLVLDRSSGSDLRVVTAIRQGRKVVVGFTIQGSGIILPMAPFGFSRVRRTCIAKGWQFPA
jgi:hypothetical protein